MDLNVSLEFVRLLAARSLPSQDLLHDVQVSVSIQSFLASSVTMLLSTLLRPNHLSYFSPPLVDLGSLGCMPCLRRAAAAAAQRRLQGSSSRGR